MKARNKGYGMFFALVGAMIIGFGVYSKSVEANDDLMKSCMSVAKTDCSKWAATGGGGGGLPRGLTSGTTVELAPGERYVLTGVVVQAKNSNTQQMETFLKVDLDEHPWLASARRKSTPYYRVSDNANRWKQYNRKTVTGIFRADAAIWEMTEDRFSYEIFLTPTAGTVIVEGSIR